MKHTVGAMCAKMLNLLCGGMAAAALTRENRDFLRFCNCFSQNSKIS